MMGIGRWRVFRAAAGFAGLIALAAFATCSPVLAQTQTPASAHANDPAIWVDFKKIERAQPALLERQFAGLSQHKTASDIYVVGVAGWSAQDVFIKELDGAIASLSKVLPLRGDHVVRLINNVKTLDTVPVANPDNFHAALRAVGQSMNKANDILIIFMTSHGTQNGVALKLGRAAAELSPQEVADALNREQIRNRIVIVSACYSGVYITPLANDDTIVLTAAHRDNPSFGCSAKRSWTFFGDAFFNQSLRPGADFRHAFARAKTLIAKWEAAEKFKPSNPQAHFGETLTRKLDPLWKGAAQKRS
jgi:hypothetical protein